MALGDGDTWDETTPTDATVAIQIDDYMRHVAKGVRSRMAFEHEWPSSQAATAEGGKHKYITLQMQSTAPAIAGTQVGAVYQKTVATTGDCLFFLNAATQEIALNKKMYYWYFNDEVETGTSMGATLYLVSDGKIAVARGAISTVASGGAGVQIDVLYNGSSIWNGTTASQIILAPGSTSTAVTAFITTNVTAGGTFTLDIDKVGTVVPGGNVTVMVEVW